MASPLRFAPQGVLRGRRVEQVQPHKAAIPADEAKKDTAMKLMTIFQLAVLTDQELQALALKASKDEGNAILARQERDTAAANRHAIARRRAMALKP